MKKLLLLFFTIFFFCGCSPQKRIARIAEKYNITQLERVRYVDTLYFPPKTVMFQTYVDSLQNFEQTVGGWTISGCIGDDGLVTAKVIKPADTIITDKDIDIPTIKVNKVERVTPVKDIIMLLIVLGFLVVVLVLLFKKK